MRTLLLAFFVFQILFLRGVYPSASFCKRRKYGIPVRMCEHPSVAAFCTEHLASLREALVKRRQGLDGVEVALLQRQRVAERIVFEFGDAEAEAKRLEARERDAASLLLAEELELRWRALLLRMNSVLASMPGLEKDKEKDDLSFRFRLRASVKSSRALTSEDGDELWAVDGGEDDEEDLFTSCPGQVVPIYGIKRPVRLNVYVIR